MQRLGSWLVDRMFLRKHEDQSLGLQISPVPACLECDGGLRHEQLRSSGVSEPGMCNSEQETLSHTKCKVRISTQIWPMTFTRVP